MYKRKILYSCKFSVTDIENCITTKNYLFLYGRFDRVIIFDIKTIKPIQSKNISEILFIDEISTENIKFITVYENIYCDKSQKNKIFYFYRIRIFSFFLLLLLFIREIKIISSKKYKLLNDNISFEDIIKYIKSTGFSSDNLVLKFFKFKFELINVVEMYIFLLKNLFPALKFAFFSNYLIIIIIRCIFFLYYILILSFYYQESSATVSFISDNY